MLTLPPTAASWKTPLQDVISQTSWATLCARVEEAYNSAVCFPPKHELFKAFELCSPQQIKVVILGQDPYHGAGQANGLAFSVHTGVKAPPSLRNLLKEAFDDVGAMPWVDLSRWAELASFCLSRILWLQAFFKSKCLSRIKGTYEGRLVSSTYCHIAERFTLFFPTFVPCRTRPKKTVQKRQSPSYARMRKAGMHRRLPLLSCKATEQRWHKPSRASKVAQKP
jgi:hypothetical protein